ncbi:hypothetical protein [Ralstonia holmesii]|uniref:DNA-binding protein n=1 Tax=Ralstonia holmesii TaxID=3058602 RepID=A0ABC8QE68_9RALS|nr:hypothetical protein [Ralstonia sp. LMG 32967]CAJ0792822.1 hypothetical protein LMG18096_02735 [Ralstonia sp. LMG 32967]CAJ0819556.1 hypothetical protein LMG18093_04074 [Ralstonia sp. LMG 32967]
MTDDLSPQERIAASRQLYAVLRQYLERPTWTPIEGALILSGIHPPPNCTEIPANGTGLDGRIAGADRLLEARRIWEKWGWHCEDEEKDGVVTPTELSPYEFLRWCEDWPIETEWLLLYRNLLGYGREAAQVDVIPLPVVEYATRTAKAVDVILDKLGSAESAEVAGEQNKKSSPRSPMPVPMNRDFLSTEEFAKVLAVNPQSLHKRYSATGSYHGVRPKKLPNGRLHWPVERVKALLNGEKLDKEPDATEG